jgi:hypothetical protein
MASISISIRRSMMSRSISALTAKARPGVVRTASAVGFVIVDARPEASRVGIRSGERLCVMRSTFCAMKTFRTLKPRAATCSRFRGSRAMIASRLFSSRISRANSFCLNTQGDGYLLMKEHARSRISNFSGCCC